MVIVGDVLEALKTATSLDDFVLITEEEFFAF
jgi:hypothetical protein